MSSREDHANEDYREYRRWRRSFRNPWVWIAIAALIIIPVTAYGIIQHDNFVNTMEHKGCHIVNEFDDGARVWECPRRVR